MNCKEFNLSTDALPPERGKKMPFIYNPDGSTTIIVHYHKPGTPPGHGTTKRKTIKTQEDRAVQAAWGKLIEECQGSSLTVRFHKCVELALSYNDGAGMRYVYEAIKDKLGSRFADKRFPDYYNAYVADLKNRKLAKNTISNHISCIRRSLKVAHESGLIERIPIRKFEIVQKFRNRVWTEEERQKIYAAFGGDTDDDLYWKIYFAERNPIRKMDVSNMTRDNLKLKSHLNPDGPYIVHYPRKTKDTAPKPCILPEIDEALLQRFDELKRRFPDCPYLFPNIIKNKREGTERWEYAGSFYKAFAAHIKACGIPDFHYHDMKHVAITNMLRSGRYTRADLEKLGVQMSDAIDVYDQTEGIDTLRLLRKRGTVEEPQQERKVS